jgi:hypothetical protein
MTVDNAQLRYVIRHLHRFSNPNRAMGRLNEKRRRDRTHPFDTLDAETKTGWDCSAGSAARASCRTGDPARHRRRDGWPPR